MRRPDRGDALVIAGQWSTYGRLHVGKQRSPLAGGGAEPRVGYSSQDPIRSPPAQYRYTTTAHGYPDRTIQRPARFTFGPHAIAAERFARVSSGTSFAQVVGAILRKHALVQDPDKDESVRQSVINLAGPADPVLRSAHPGPPAAGRVYRATTPALLADCRAGRWIGLLGQVAADLLPEADDSRAVDGGEGR